MSDPGPGASLRALVASAVDGDLSESSAPIAVAERGDDPGPGTRLADIAAGGDSIVGVVPRIDPSLARRVADEVDGEARLVFTGSAGDRLAGPTGTAVRSALSGRGVEAYRHGGDSPVGVLLVGDRAAVGLFDDRGLAAVLWSDAPPVREWAAATCRRFLAAADPV
jgi:murein DD-endopeptidase MepM/ murein hydrolase activator NlpD